MAVNNFNNVSDIAAMAMEALENRLTFTKYVNREYDDRFKESGAKIGDTTNIRIPGFYRVRRGNVADPQGYNDTSRPLTLQQYGVDLSFTTAQLRLNVDDFMRNVLDPAMKPLANDIDAQGLALTSQIYQAVGTPGTAPSGLLPFLNARAELATSGVDTSDLNAILDPLSEAGLVDSLKGLFNSTTEIDKQYREGKMGTTAGMKFSMDQNVPSYTTGLLGGTPVLASVPADGASSLSTSGWTASKANVLRAGDVFTIAGVYKVNPVQKLPTKVQQKFVVVSDVSSDGSGNATISISPAIQLTGPNQNVVALPALSAAIQPLAASGVTATNNIVFDKDAFALIAVDLPKTDSMVYCTRVMSPRLKIPFRLAKFWNGMTDSEVWRLDVMTAWAILRPTFACRVMG